VDHLHRAACDRDSLRLRARQLARREREEWPHALATTEHGVAHRCMQTLWRNFHRWQQLEQLRFNALLPGCRPALKISVIGHELLFGAAEIFQHAVFKYLDLLLRILQRRLAKFKQLRTALVSRKRFFQRQLSRLHVRDNTFELGERRFKRGIRFGFYGFGHAACAAVLNAAFKLKD
jgi:hypothetical protein